jgi:subtilisin family serine protease
MVAVSALRPTNDGQRPVTRVSGGGASRKSSDCQEAVQDYLESVLLRRPDSSITTTKRQEDLILRNSTTSSSRRRAPALALTLILLLLSLPVYGWIWDRDQNRIDDRIERTHLEGLAAAFENGDLEHGRQILALSSAGGVLRYGVFVGFLHQPTSEDLERLRATGVDTTVFHPFQTIPYVQMALTFDEIVTVSRLPGIDRIEAVEMMYAFNNVATKTSGAVGSNFRHFPTVQENLGFTGRGIVVSILDTGVNDQPDSLTGFPGHESFTGKFIAGGDFYSGQPALNTAPDESTNPIDRGPRSQHGTHVAGTTLGTGGPTRVFGGVAPGALLVDQKVLSDAGAGFGSAAGVEWAILNKDRYDIRVLNLSLGTLTESDGTDASSRAINAAFDAGLIAVVAAGNDSRTNYMPSPAAADKAFTIGALADFNTIDRSDDLVASFSNEGPRADDGDDDYEDEMKPLVVAPGSGIISASGNLTTDGRAYVSLSGTSMATPHVAGIVTLILEANPALTPSDVWEILKHTSEHRRDWGKTPAESNPFPQGDPNYHPSGGWGQVDAYAAVKEALRLAGDPASQTQVVYIHAAPAADGSAAIDLTWKSQREINLAGYDLYRAEDAGGAPGTFVKLNSSPIPGTGQQVIERTINRNVYTFRDASGLEIGKSYWYRIDHTSNDPSIGAISEPPLRVTLGEARVVARIEYSITHNAIDNDLLVLVGTGPQAERAKFVIDGKPANQADRVISDPGEATTGFLRHEFSINLTSFDRVESFLPPSKQNPWFLLVKEGGFVNRAGRVNSFSITLFDENGNPMATYSTGDPTPQQTVEGQTTMLWIPDDPNLYIPGDTPTVIEADPASGAQGTESLHVDIYGAEFTPGGSVSFSGDGITVHRAALTGASSEYHSGSHVSATISIDPSAAAGPRDITVTNIDGRSHTATAAFMVVGDGDGECTPVTASVDDSDPSVEYGSGWHTQRSESASGGTYHRRIANGNGPVSAARLVFDGNQITYLYAISDKGGTADVYIDERLVDSVSFNGPWKKPAFGSSRTYADLGEGTHELRVVARNGIVYVDGFEIGSCEMVATDASAVEMRDSTELSTATLGLTALTRTLNVATGDRAVTVTVDGSSVAPTVTLLDPAGTVLAVGDALLDGATISGIETSVSTAGTYTVRIVGASLSAETVEIAVARTISVD